MNLVATVLVEGTSTFGDSDHHLTCFGAFEVDIVDDEPVFTCHHRSTIEDADRLDLLGELGSLCTDRHVVLGSADAYETFWDRRHILRDGLTYIDTIAALETGEPSGLTLLGTPESTMIELASSFELPNCYQTDLSRQARFAAVRAQLTWLAYITTRASRSEARSLFAAYRAYQAIERAKPLPF
ncbi:MAG: hypothetical protein KKE77_06765 [Alphaproteobacteria bacterium]|nr:hypothetical protein [Alphaproteobacteria bacterium]